MYTRDCLWVPLFFLAGFGQAAGLPPGGAAADEEPAAGAKTVVARVNGQPIFEEQLKPQVEASLKTFRRYGMRKDNPDLFKRLQGKALKKIIDEELIGQESRKLTIEAIDEKVEARLKAIERKYGAGERFENYFKMRNLTVEEAREAFKKRVQVDEYLLRQGILEPEIPEDRIREAYDKDPGSFSREESLRVSHILIGVAPHAGAEEKKQARQKAEDVHKQVAGGEDFAEMAKKHSTCNSGPGGGDLGYVKRGYMPAPFEEAASALEEDAVSEVVETKFGYHVIKLLDKKPAGVVPYEEVKGFITKYLQQEESKKKLADHVEELRKKAKIEILLPE